MFTKPRLVLLLSVLAVIMVLTGCKEAGILAVWSDIQPDAAVWSALDDALEKIAVDLRERGCSRLILAGTPDFTYQPLEKDAEACRHAQRDFIQKAYVNGIITDVREIEKATDPAFLAGHRPDAVIKIEVANYNSEGACITLRWILYDPGTGRKAGSQEFRGTSSISAEEEIASAEEPKKVILALQAFIDPDEDKRIMDVCSELSSIEGYDSELGRMFIPHVTLAAWRVTPEELELAREEFQDRLTGLESIEVDVSFRKDQDEDNVGYICLPEASESLLEFQRQVYEKLGWYFEPFREYYLPGSWFPHLSLFSVPKEQEPRLDEAMKRLKETHSINIERIGLVTFSPITIESEVELEKSGR